MDVTKRKIAQKRPNRLEQAIQSIRFFMLESIDVLSPVEFNTVLETFRELYSLCLADNKLAPDDPRRLVMPKDVVVSQVTVLGLVLYSIKPRKFDWILIEFVHAGYRYFHRIILSSDTGPTKPFLDFHEHVCKFMACLQAHFSETVGGLFIDYEYVLRQVLTYRIGLTSEKEIDNYVDIYHRLLRHEFSIRNPPHLILLHLTQYFFVRRKGGPPGPEQFKKPAIGLLESYLAKVSSKSRLPDENKQTMNVIAQRFETDALIFSQILEYGTF